MQALILRGLEIIDEMLYNNESICLICGEQESHTSDCELRSLIQDLQEALEDPFNS